MIKQRDDKLTKDEELALGFQIQAMKELKEKMETDKIELTKEDRKIILDGEDAFEVLVGNYYNLARDIAHKHHRRTGTRYEIEDLLQDAIGALCEAAYDYDPSKNCKLSTYAFYGITKKVSTAINYNRIVRMPENKMTEYAQIIKAQQAYSELQSNLDKEVDGVSELQYIYNNVGDLKKEEVDLILNNMQPQVSLNAIINESGGELMGILPSDKAEFTDLDFEDLDDDILKVLKRLTPEEVQLLSYEYEAIPSRIPYDVFLEENDLTDRKAKTQIRRAIRRMRAVGLEIAEEGQTK